MPCTCNCALLLALAIALLLHLPPSSAGANAGNTVQRLQPKDIARLFQKKGYVYLDVRTPEEFAQVHVPGSVNIPFMYSSPAGRSLNANFIKQVEARFPNSKQLLVVGCATGHRSAQAAGALAAAGKYSGIVDNAGGIFGWMAAGLPVIK